jgi:hypothetical protein
VLGNQNPEPLRRRYLLNTITLASTFASISSHVMELSSQKLCSNPKTPHPQPYPTPVKCGQCGYAVN